jgi:hypothetical protein
MDTNLAQISHFSLFLSQAVEKSSEEAGMVDASERGSEA